jgi:hypothetical protein
LKELSSQSRAIVEAGIADGMYATPAPLLIVAYRSAQVAQVNMARSHMRADTLDGSSHPRTATDSQRTTLRVRAVQRVP